MKSRTAASSAYRCGGTLNAAVITLLPSNPGFVRSRLRKLASSRPAPTSRTTEIAICATTRPRRSARARRPRVPPLPSAPSTRFKFSVRKPAAEPSPMSAPTDERALPSVNAMTGQLIPNALGVRHRIEVARGIA